MHRRDEAAPASAQVPDGATLRVRLFHGNPEAFETIGELHFRGAKPPLPPQGSADAVRVIYEERSRRGIFLAVYQGNEMLDIGRLSFLEGLPDSGRKGVVMEVEEKWTAKKEEGDEGKEGEVGKDYEEWKRSSAKKEEEERKRRSAKKEEEEEKEGPKAVEKEAVAKVLLKLWPGFSHAVLVFYCRGRWKLTRAYCVHWLSQRDKGLGSGSDSIAASSVLTTWRINLTCKLEFEGALICTEESIGLNDMDKIRNIQKLTNGGCSQVYQCDYLGGHYALKGFTGYFNHEEPSEIDIMSSLENDTTVTFYQAWFDAKKQCVLIHMEFCERTLLEFIGCGNEGSTTEQKWMLFEKIAKGVQYIHQRGVIHRDLKPANMFYGMDGTLKIGDFGHSCWSGRGTQGSQNLGSVCYSAPELTNPNVTAIDKVDIFSLGVIYLEIFVPYDEKRFLKLYDLWSGVYNLTWPVDMELLKKLTATCPSDRPSIDEVLERISSKRTKTDDGEEDKAGASDNSRPKVGGDDLKGGGGKMKEDNLSINKKKESTNFKRTKTDGEECESESIDKSKPEVKDGDEKDDEHESEGVKRGWGVRQQQL